MPKKLHTSPAEGEERALRLLGRNDYSREGMRQKLTGKGLAEGEVEAILRKLEVHGLLNDQRYASRLAAFYAREKLWGPHRLTQKLLDKGVALELAREVTQQAEEEGPSRERLRKLLRSKMKGQGLKDMNPKEKRRLASYLRQRGFLWDDILEALEKAGGFTEE